MKRNSSGRFAAIVALLALVVAMAGTSYAAVTLPKKSVGTAQLKANAVKSKKVKDGSLLAKDFKAGQLPTTPVLASQNNTNHPGATNDEQTQINSVTITVPADGTLLVSGTVFVNNDGAAAVFTSVPRVDGATITSGGWGAAHFAGADGAGASERFTLAYTIPVPVTAGTHTVTQHVGPNSDTTEFFYRNNTLSALYVPGSTPTP